MGVGAAVINSVYYRRFLLEPVATTICDEARAKHHASARRPPRPVLIAAQVWSTPVLSSPRWGFNAAHASDREITFLVSTGSRIASTHRRAAA